MHRRQLFTQRRSAGGAATYEIHALLRAYLRHKALATWSPERRAQVLGAAARVLEGSGEAAEALPLYSELGDWAGAVRCILGAAQPLVAQGRRQTLIAWIDSLPAPLVEREPRLAYWRGSAMAPTAPREARAQLRRAYEGFVRTGDRLGAILAAAGVVFTHYLELAHLDELDPWVDVLCEALQGGMRFPTAAIELHVRSAMLFICAFRRPDPALLDPCVDRMLELLGSGLGANDRVPAASLLLAHFFNRGRIEDGQRLVATTEPAVSAPELNPASRALWWMLAGYFQCIRGDLEASRSAFDLAMQVSTDNGLAIPAVDVYARNGLCMCELLDGDLEKAESWRAAGFSYWSSFRRMDMAAAAMLKGIIASHRGEMQAAHDCAHEHRTVSREVGVDWQMFNGLAHCAFVAAVRGEREECARYAQEARDLVRQSVQAHFAYQADFIEAYACLLAGDRAGLREKLARSLPESVHEPARYFLRLQPQLLPRLYAAALAEGIEPGIVRGAIREFRIPPPTLDAPGWPWPIAVTTLGRFEVQREGQPLEFSRKAPKKTLQLLKAIIAHGTPQVPEQWLLDALWGDEEGDAAVKSLGAAVMRLRALLGDATAIVQRGGTLALDRAHVWVDARAFEASSDPELYRGTFLEEEEGAPWAVPLRERLRARFVQALGERGADFERRGMPAAAIELYLRGLDADSLVEPFYQGLMRCYQRLDRRAEALSTYRRLRQVFSVTLGLAPSATTERLLRSLRLEAPDPQSVGDK
jgi:DNA-binding SARP family transcriptional activator